MAVVGEQRLRGERRKCDAERKPIWRLRRRLRLTPWTVLVVWMLLKRLFYAAMLKFGLL